MSKVSAIKPEPNKGLVTVLEDALEKAKKGEIVAGHVAWVTAKGSIGGDFSSGRSNWAMWASVEHSARQYYTDIILGGEHDE